MSPTRRHPVLRGALFGVVMVLALGAAAWGLGYVRLGKQSVQAAAPAHSLAGARRLTASIGPTASALRRSSATRRRLLIATGSAVDQLVGSGSTSTVSWDPATGLWDFAPVREERATGRGRTPTWWQSAIALDAVVRAATTLRSVNPVYQQVIQTTYAHNVSKPGTYAPSDFENNYMDDTGWWGIAWADAARYELQVRHDTSAASTYLRIAEDDARYLAAQPKRCGAAAIPFKDGFAPNTITDAEYIELVALLGQIRSAHGSLADARLAGQWTADAAQTLAWLEGSGLIDLRTGSVHRTENARCRPGGPAQTYTEGEVAQALTQVGVLTHDPTEIDQAALFINRVLHPAHGMIHQGVLQEQCEATAGRCAGQSYNITVFKGLFDNAAADWMAAAHSTVYDGVLRAQAAAVIRNATGVRGHVCATAGTCHLSMYWARRVPVAREALVATPGSQASGLVALVNALGVTPAS
jgi:hypothetical protein